MRVGSIVAVVAQDVILPSIEQWHTWWEQNKSRFPGADPDAVQPIQVVKQKAINPKEEPKGKG